jgi:curli biogenesis system outer membrane secretion channel CsgG
MKMQRFLPTCVAGLTLLAGALVVSAQTPALSGRKPRVAVMDFDYGTVQSAVSAVFGTNVDVGKGIQTMLVTGLVKDGSFSVIERAVLDKVLNEQNFSNSNRADPNSAAKIGKLLGVDAIIVGTITEFGNETKNTGLGGGGGSGWTGALGGFHHSKSNSNVAITARIINIDTGEIMAVADGNGTSSRSSTGMGGGGGNWNGHGGGAVDFGSSDFQNTIIGEATKAAVDQLATNLDAQAGKVPVRTIVVEGEVAAVDSGQVILNVGAKAGIKVGDQFNVMRVTRIIKDPSTGAILRKMTSTVGVVKATDVDDISAVCSPVSGTDFKVGDVIKTVTQ